MAEGQLALNTAAASTGLFFKDAAGALVKSGPVHIGTTAPNATPASGGHAGNSVGESWLDTSGSNPILKIWSGTAWLETGGLAQLNVIHVDATNGDDANDGHLVTNAKKTIKAAVTAASAGDIVKVSPGVYQETLPIDITVTNLSIVGDSTRSVFVHPTVATETGTMFRCNSGTYIEGFTFCGLKASGTRGDHPIDDDNTYGLPEFQGWVAGFYPGAVIRKSPWIENCTNFADSGINNASFDPNNYSGTGGDITSGPTGGGVLVDGFLPDVTSPLRSFIINEFTQVCLDGPGLLVCNNGYAQAVSYFGIFNHYQAKALSGGQINMEVGTTNFGRYALIADGKSSTAIFTATANGAAAADDVTFAIDAPTASAGWFGDANRPAINMLVKIGSDIYPILSSSVNGTGWNVTISRPDPTDRSINLGLINGHADEATVEFFLRSMVSTASHTFEYAGAGTDYRALPENGGEPIEVNEAVQLNDGRVWLTSTDQTGKFKVGDTFQVDQQTGFVTIDPNSVSVNIVSDGTPQLGGDLDVLNRKIYTSLGNTGVVVEGNGTGPVTLKSGAADRLVVNSTQVTAGFLGTASAPAYSFIADPNTGIYSPGANEIALTTDGTQRLVIDSTGNVTLKAQGDLRLADSDSSHYVGFQAPATVLANLTWTLPDADGTNGQALSTDGSGVLGWSSYLPIGGGALTGDLTLNAQSDLRFADADSSNWVAFQGPATVSSNVTWTLPAADGTTGQVLSTNGSGTLSWATGGTGGGASVTTSDTAPSTPADGDLWYDSVGGRLYVYYDDGNTNQWVDAAPQGGGDAGFSKLEIGNTKAEVTDTGSNGTFTVTTEGTGRLSVDSSGRTLLGGVTANANGGVLQLSSGITFPATQVAATDPNTLDDYEEGSWTPAWVFSTSGSATISITAAHYVKIGKIVIASCQIGTSALSSPTGDATLAGLPFSSGAVTRSSVAIGFVQRWETSITLRGSIPASSSSIGFFVSGTIGEPTTLAGSDFRSTGNPVNLLHLTVCYEV
jgi:hypothetical protein